MVSLYSVYSWVGRENVELRHRASTRSLNTQCFKLGRDGYFDRGVSLPYMYMRKRAKIILINNLVEFRYSSKVIGKFENWGTEVC